MVFICLEGFCNSHRRRSALDYHSSRTHEEIYAPKKKRSTRSVDQNAAE
jgi:hypothetical protein